MFRVLPASMIVCCSRGSRTSLIAGEVERRVHSTDGKEDDNNQDQMRTLPTIKSRTMALTEQMDLMDRHP